MSSDESMTSINLISEPAGRRESQSGEPAKRKFVGIKFNCCRIYVRIYVNQEGTAYEGHCPKCFKPVKLKIGTGGTSSRFFEAY
ncbi:MAG: hypothetical protein LBT46_08910 [Planctomycetaceae bacterium]|jgi:hypothetical protein|nr:hypothetical protein [Planctomycetaceae bacterium]